MNHCGVDAGVGGVREMRSRFTAAAQRLRHSLVASGGLAMRKVAGVRTTKAEKSKIANLSIKSQ